MEPVGAWEAEVGMLRRRSSIGTPSGSQEHSSQATIHSPLSPDHSQACGWPAGQGGLASLREYFWVTIVIFLNDSNSKC